MDEYLKLGILLIDPTGISSWKDASNAVKIAYNDRTLKNIGIAGLELLGAVPIIGKVGKIGKLGKFANVGSKKLISKLYPEINKTTELISRKIIPGLEDGSVLKMTDKEMDRFYDLINKTEKTIKNKLISLVEQCPEILKYYQQYPEHFYGIVKQEINDLEEIVDKTNEILRKRQQGGVIGINQIGINGK